MKKLLIYSLALATVAWSLSFAFISPVNAASINDGDVIKLATSPAVYYVSGGKKMLMPNRGVYSSWSSAIGDQNDKFATLKVVSSVDFGSLPFGPNMTVRPGTGLIKFTDSNDFFAVGYDNKLYKLADANVKSQLYPNVTIITLTESFRANYYEYSNPVAVLTANSTYPDGTLIKATGDSDIYLIEDGKKRLISLEVFNENGFKNQWVVTTDISKYQQGVDLKGQRDRVVVPLSINNWKINYRPLGMPISYKYPIDWSIQKVATVDSGSVTDSGKDAIFEVTEEKELSGLTPKQAFERQRQNYEAIGYEMETTLAGMNAYKVQGQTLPDASRNYGLGIEKFYVSYQGKIYVISFLDWGNRRITDSFHYSVYQEILNTFSFVN